MSGVPPVFVLSRNLLDENIGNYEVCLAAAKTVGRDGILGAQKIGSLWHLYPKNSEARVCLLSKGFSIGGRQISVSAQNPFLIRGSDGEEILSTRLTVSDIPISFSNSSLEAALIKLGLKLRSKIKMEN